MVMEQKPALESRLERIVRDAQLYRQKKTRQKQFVITSLCLGTAIFIVCNFVTPHMVSDASVWGHKYAVDSKYSSPWIPALPRVTEETKPLEQEQKPQTYTTPKLTQQEKTNETTKQQIDPSTPKQPAIISPKPEVKQAVTPDPSEVVPIYPTWQPTKWYQKGDHVLYIIKRKLAIKIFLLINVFSLRAFGKKLRMKTNM
jgi:hypothetical protein